MTKRHVSLPPLAEEGLRAFIDEVDERPIRVRDYLRSTKACKLHDFETGTWYPYPTD